MFRESSLDNISNNGEKLQYSSIFLTHNTIGNHLNNLNIKLLGKDFENGKNQIDAMLNVTSGVGGLYDGVINNNQADNIIKYITLELLHNNVKINKKLDNISFTDLEYYISNAIKKILLDKKEFPSQIVFTIDNISVEFDLQSISEKMNKEIKKEKSQDILVDLFLNKIGNKELLYLEVEFDYKGNIDDGVNKGYIDLLNKYIEKGIFTESELLDLHNNKVFSTGLLMNYFEQKDGFNLVEFIEQFGLPNYIYKLGIKYVREILKIDNKDLNDNEIIKNILGFVMIFLGVESDGRNVGHYKNKSSSQGYFQFLTKDGAIQNGERGGSSFITAMNNLKKFIPSKEYNDDKNKDFEKRFTLHLVNNKRDQDPKKLSAENQILLMLGNLFGREEKNNNGDKVSDRFIKKHLNDYFLLDNTWSLSQVYYKKHHGDAKDKEGKRFRSYRDKYIKGEGKILIDLIMAKNHY